MSKIICDVCGTSYHETATQCPICGCVRPADTVTVNTENVTDEPVSRGTYTYVKGGRFSKANVKKRNSANRTAPVEAEYPEETIENKGGKVNVGLTVVICVLLLAIVAVVAYIVLQFFAPNLVKPSASEPIMNNSASSATENTTQASTVATIPCVDVIVSNTVVELDKVGAAYLLNVSVDPVDTTDEILFTSADESVATVTTAGKIIAVAPGQTVITITCGDLEAECRVVCAFETATEETTEPVTEPTVSDEDFKLNREDFTMNKKGEAWLLYNGKIPAKQIIWTSDNEKVVTIADGVVTAVGEGITKIHGEYNGKKVSCVVRCSSAVGKFVEASTETENTTPGDYNISTTDVTLYLNGAKSFELKLLDSERKAVDVIWNVENSDICAVDGNTVTGLSAGSTKISVTYEGETYTCVVRVRNS